MLELDCPEHVDMIVVYLDKQVNYRHPIPIPALTSYGRLLFVSSGIVLFTSLFLMSSGWLLCCLDLYLSALLTRVI